MRYANRTKAQLIAELNEKHRYISELEKNQAERFFSTQLPNKPNKGNFFSVKPLKENIQLIDSILNYSIKMAIIITNRDLQIQYYNTGAQEIFGYAAKNVIGKTVPEMHATAKIIPQKFESAIKEIKEKGEYNSNLDWETENGMRYLSWKVKGIWDENKKLSGFILIARDVTNSIIKQKLLRVENELASALNLTKNISEALRIFLKFLCRIPEIDCGCIYILDGKSGKLNLASHKSLSKLFIKHVPYFTSNPHQERIVKDGKPVFCTYSEIEPDMDEIRKKEGLCAVALLPIKAEGKVIALVNLASKKWDNFNIFTKNTLITISTQLGAVIERLSAKQKVLDSEMRFKALSKATFEAIFISKKGVCIDANKSASDMFGFTYDELIGIFGTDVIAPESKELVKQNMLTSYEKQYEAVAVRKDGTTFPAEFQGKMFEINGEKVRATAVRDITERKQAEEKMRYLNRGIKAAGEAIIMTNAAGTIQFVNPAFTKITGYTQTEAIGRTPRIINSGLNSIEFYEDMWNTIREGKIWNGELTNKRNDNIFYEAELTIAPVLDKNNKVEGYVAIQSDITSRKQTEIALNKSEEHYRRLVSNLKEVVFQTDSEGRWIFLNSAWEEVTGFSVEDSLSKVFLEYVYPEDVERNLKLFEPLIERKKDYCRHEIRYRHKDGGFRWIEVFARLTLDEQDNVIGTTGTLTDISEHRKAEQVLKKSKDDYKKAFELFRLMADNSPVLLWAKDIKGKYIFVNRAICEKLLNAKDTTEPIGKTDLYFAERERAAHPDDPSWYTLGKSCIDSDKKTLMKRKTCRFNEYGKIFGKPLAIDVYKSPLKNESGKIIGTVGSARIVTKERKLVEAKEKAKKALKESENKFKSFAEQSPNMIFINQGGKVKYMNKICTQLLEYTYDEFYSENFDFRNLVAPEHLDLLERNFRTHMNGKDVEPYEYTLISKNGNRIESIINSQLIDFEGSKAILGVVTDITERKRAEEKIEKSLKEKEVLLKEIHHRVKNNMQIIISLLNLQSHKIKNNKAKKAFIDSNNRIRAMSLTHEILYQSKDLEKINLREYVERLIQTSIRAISGVSTNIEYDLDIEKIVLAIDDTIPIALILNELLTNVNKYAFKGMNKGRVKISVMEFENSKIELIFSDNGVGLPKGINLRNSDTLGFQIISDLTEGQLGGTIEQRNNNGCTFIIKFVKKDIND